MWMQGEGCDFPRKAFPKGVSEIRSQLFVVNKTLRKLARLPTCKQNFSVFQTFYTRTKETAGSTVFLWSDNFRLKFPLQQTYNYQQQKTQCNILWFIHGLVHHHYLNWKLIYVTFFSLKIEVLSIIPINFD